MFIGRHLYRLVYLFKKCTGMECKKKRHVIIILAKQRFYIAILVVKILTILTINTYSITKVLRKRSFEVIELYYFELKFQNDFPNRITYVRLLWVLILVKTRAPILPYRSIIAKRDDNIQIDFRTYPKSLDIVCTELRNNVKIVD